jgi:hypothetical protein
MDFLRNDMLKITAFIFLVLISLPLLLPRADIEDSSAPPAQVAAARESSAKAIAADGIGRIFDFYGLNKLSSAPAAADARIAAPSSQNTDTPVNQPPYEKLELAAAAARASIRKQVQAARAGQSASLYDVPARDSGFRVAFEAGAAEAERAKIPEYLSEKGALSLNGKSYDFLRSYGKEWAITESGPVALADFFARGAVYTGKNSVLTPLPQGRQNPAQPDLYTPSAVGDYGAASVSAQAKISGGAGGPRGTMTADLKSVSLNSAQYGGAKTYTARGAAAKAVAATPKSGVGSLSARGAAMRPSQPLLAENEDYMRRNYYEPQERADAAARAGEKPSLLNIRMSDPVLGKNYKVELENAEITKTSDGNKSHSHTENGKITAGQMADGGFTE